VNQPISTPRTLRTLVSAAAVLTLAACGSSGSDTRTDAAAQKPDSAIQQVARQPMSETDLAGLTTADVSLEIPWTAGKASRDPTPDAPAAPVLSVNTQSTEGFDRVLIVLADSAAFPGYEVTRGQPGDTLVCGSDARTLDLGGSAVLRVRLTPARRVKGEAVPTKDTGLTRFQKAGVVCDDGQSIVWAAGLSAGKEMRVLELRNPPRLAVDVR
jgi:hypothetical protein